MPSIRPLVWPQDRTAQTNLKRPIQARRGPVIPKQTRPVNATQTRPVRPVRPTRPFFQNGLKTRPVVRLGSAKVTKQTQSTPLDASTPSAIASSPVTTSTTRAVWPAFAVVMVVAGTVILAVLLFVVIPSLQKLGSK
jgi:hypothetical protein